MAFLVQLPGETYEEWTRRNALMGNTYQTNVPAAPPPAAQAPVTGSFQNWFGDVPPEVMAPIAQQAQPAPGPAQQQQTGGPTVPQIDDPTRRAYEEEQALGQYYEQLGIPDVGGNPYDKWRRSQFAPTYTAYNLSRYLNPAGASPTPGAQPPDFRSYLQNTGIGGASAALPRQLAALKGRPYTELEDIYDVLGNTGFESLLGADLSQRYGNLFGQQMAGRASSMRPSYELQAGRPGGSASFLDYLLSRYGI